MTPRTSAPSPDVEQTAASAPLHTDLVRPVQSQLEREQPVSAEPKPYLCRRPVRLALYAILIGLLLLMLGWRFLPGLLDPTFEKHILNKQVMVGMSRQQVLKAWGSPYSMNVSYTKDGTRREEWIYEDWVDAATVKHRYLYFEEDELLGGWYYK